ncbi:MAG: hypothetical protein [Caudoviricetes sp.]|nr:MAG: hypothetical protein [Caudoviricetes sp.]
MSHESAKLSIVNYIKESSVNQKSVIKGVVYNEGGVAYQYMLDQYTPGNKMTLWNIDSESPFKKFKSYNSGVSVKIGGTYVSIFAGQIDEIGVLFVYPTSPKVDHEEIEKFFKDNFSNLFFVEHDINFIGSYNRKVKEFNIYTSENKSQYIEQVLKDCYTLFINNNMFATVKNYIDNVIFKAENNLSVYLGAKATVSYKKEFEKSIQNIIIEANNKYSLGTYSFYIDTVREISKLLDNN